MSQYGRADNATRWRTYQPVPPGRTGIIDSRRPVQGTRGMHVAQGSVNNASRFNAENRSAKKVTIESHRESDLVQVEYQQDSRHRGLSDYNRNTRVAHESHVPPPHSHGHLQRYVTRGHHAGDELSNGERLADTRGLQPGHGDYYGVDGEIYKQRGTAGYQSGYQRDAGPPYRGQRREVTQDMVNEFTRNTKYSPEEDYSMVGDLPYNRNGYNRNTKTVKIDAFGFDEEKLPYTDTSGYQVSAPYAVEDTSKKYHRATGSLSPYDNSKFVSRGAVTSHTGGLPGRTATTGQGHFSRTPNTRCTICKEYARDPRMLRCQHSFCRHCLELLLQRRSAIICPICRETTQLDRGARADDLPAHGLFETSSELDKEVVVEVKGVVSDITIAHDVIVAGCNNKMAPIYIFDFQGNTLAQVGRDIIGPSPKLTYNSKRNLLIANVKNKIASFERTGSLVAQLANPAFQYACGVVYHMSKDWYIIPDEKTNALQCYNPQAARVVRTIGLRRDEPNPFSFPACIACDNHGGTGLIAISDRRNHLIKVIDLDGQYAQTFGYRGKGYGQLENPLGVCFDRVGRLLICDSGNKRVVRLTPDTIEGQEQWECLLSSGSLGNAQPKGVDVSAQGVLAVSTYQKAIAAPDCIHIFVGYE